LLQKRDFFTGNKYYILDKKKEKRSAKTHKKNNCFTQLAEKYIPTGSEETFPSAWKAFAVACKFLFIK